MFLLLVGLLGCPATSDSVAPTVAVSEDNGTPRADITQVGPNTYEVRKQVFESITVEQLEQGRALLHRGSDDSFDGYRISSLKKDNMAVRMGLRNGDIVHSVNGMLLTSVDTALAAYMAIIQQSDARYVIEMTRRGQPVTLTLVVVD